jgi:lysophospholipase L1-like esterase
MRAAGVISLICLAISGSPAVAQAPTQGVIVAEALLRHAPGPYGGEIALSPGTAVLVGVCFDRGAYCFVHSGDRTGYVEGHLIEAQGGRMDEIERLRWPRLDAGAKGALAPEETMIVAWGDSLTAGAGAPVGSDFGSKAEALFGFARDVDVEGIGGQNSTAIVARMNAIATTLSFRGATIPASGPVEVTSRSTTGVTHQGPSALAGTVCGVLGMLGAQSTDGGQTYAYDFTRATPGDAVPCPDGSEFRFVAGDQLRKRIAWLWMGTNGADIGHSISGDIAAAVASLGHDRYLVGSLLLGSTFHAARVADVKATNALLARTYGRRFVDIGAALAAAGDGSAGDAADVAAGYPPRSLRVDQLHLNARGYAIVAKAWHDATIELGF